MKQEQQNPERQETAKLLFTETEASRLLSISPRSLQKIRKDGLVAFVRIGKDGVRYSRDALQVWIDRSQQFENAEQVTNGDNHQG